MVWPITPPVSLPSHLMRCWLPYIRKTRMTIPNKRVAVLSPVAWRTPPRQYGAWETVASNITEGLVARGWDVTLFASRDSVTRAHLHAVVDKGYEEDSAVDPKVAEYLHISEAFERAAEFDLIPVSYTHLTLPTIYSV